MHLGSGIAPIKNDRAAMVIGRASTAARPAMLAARRKGGDENVIRASGALENIPADVDCASESSGDVDVARRIDGDSVQLSPASGARVTESPDPGQHRAAGALSAEEGRVAGRGAGTAVQGIARELDLATVRGFAVAIGEACGAFPAAAAG